MKLRSIEQAVELLNKEWHDYTPDWLVPYRNALYEVVPGNEMEKPPFWAKGRTALRKYWALATASTPFSYERSRVDRSSCRLYACACRTNRPPGAVLHLSHAHTMVRERRLPPRPHSAHLQLRGLVSRVLPVNDQIPTIDPGPVDTKPKERTKDAVVCARAQLRTSFARVRKHELRRLAGARKEPLVSHVDESSRVCLLLYVTKSLSLSLSLSLALSVSKSG